MSVNSTVFRIRSSARSLGFSHTNSNPERIRSSTMSKRAYHSIAGACEDQGRRSYGGQYAADVDLHERSPPQFGHRRTHHAALELAEHFSKSGSVGCRAVEQIGQRTFSPTVVDLVEPQFDFGKGEPSREVRRLL